MPQSLQFKAFEASRAFEMISRILSPSVRLAMPLLFAELISSKTKGPGEKGAPRNHPEISSQKLVDFECRLPYDSYGRDRAPLWTIWFTAEERLPPPEPEGFLRSGV